MAVPDDHGVAQNVRAIVQGGYELLDASRGGFAKVDRLLLDFIETTQQACGLPLESLYTGKALLALKQQVAAGRFPADASDLRSHRRLARPPRVGCRRFGDHAQHGVITHEVVVVQTGRGMQANQPITDGAAQFMPLFDLLGQVLVFADQGR